MSDPQHDGDPAAERPEMTPEEKIIECTLERDTAHQTGDVEAEARASHNLGNALRESGRFDDAIEAYTRARDICEQFGAVRGQALVWNNIGDALRKADRFDAALDAHTRARDLFHQVGDTDRELMSGQSLGHALLRADREDEAVRVLDQVAQGYKDAGNPRQARVVKMSTKVLRRLS